MFGATYMVLSPEHPWVRELTTAEQREAVEAYIKETQGKSDRDRLIAKEKTGCFTGAMAVNPANDERIPIWIADYVMMGYGTGAIMAVPGQDERDWEFAEVFDLPIIRTVQPDEGFAGKAFTGDGPAINSGFLNGLGVAEAKGKMTQWLESKGLGQAVVNYKLRDWLFSRQRYWGEPFPLLHMEDGTVRLMGADELPLTLPDVQKYEVAGTGEGPLAVISDWINITDPVSGRKARRESNTMPQWAGSCWYYLRYIDPRNPDEAWDKEKENYWMPVDLYLGGTEHAVLHLLYARFWHKVLFDLGLVSTSEPFQKLRNQGMILGENGDKMSKSRGNVVNPDDVIADQGADALRLYLMFLGPLERDKPWNTKGIEGVRRFLDRAWRLFMDEVDEQDVLAAAVRDVQADEAFVNEMTSMEVRPKAVLEDFLKLLAPYAPHMAEELWSRLGHAQTLAHEAWPVADEKYLVADTITLAVQVMGKLRDTIEVPAEVTEDEIRAILPERGKLKPYLEGKRIVKLIHVPGRLVNLVVK